MFLFSDSKVAVGTEGLAVGTCFGSIEIRTISLQAYMDVFTAGPETSPDRQSRSPRLALSLNEGSKTGERVLRTSVLLPKSDSTRSTARFAVLF